MPRTSDPLDDVPEFSPIHQEYRVADIGMIEIHREVYDDAGHKRWKAVLGDWKPHTSLPDIKAVAGGGSFRIRALRPGNKPLFTVTRLIDGKPRDGSEDGERGDPDDDTVPDDESLKLVHKTIEQQTAILPAAFATLTTAMVQAASNATDRGTAMVERMEAMVRNHASTIEGMRATHAAEIAQREAELSRRDARIADLEARLEKLTGENASYLRTLAEGKRGNEYVAAFKELAPELGKLADKAKGLLAEKTGAGAPGEAAKQLAAQQTKRLGWGT